MSGQIAKRPAWMERVAASITDDDLEAILRKQVEKAKKGDTTSARFILDFVGKSQPTANVFNTQINVTRGRVKAPHPLAVRMETLIEAGGPQTLRKIASELSVPPEQVQSVLEDFPGTFATVCERRGEAMVHLQRRN